MERIGDDEVVNQVIPGGPETTTEFLNDRSEVTGGEQPEAKTLLESIDLSEIESQEGQLNFACKVNFKALSPDARIPERGTPDSAGYDLYSSEDVMIPPRETVMVPLGFATEIDPYFHGRIESRSGMAVNGAVVLTGVIDADYRGEWKVILHNLTPEEKRFAKGTRVAQVVFRPTVAAAFQSVIELSESSRAGGFGSTGTR